MKNTILIILLVLTSILTLMRIILLVYQYLTHLETQMLMTLGKVFSKTDGIVVVPNLNLEPEKILSSEFIWKFIRDQTSLDLVLFYSDLKDIEKRPFFKWSRFNNL